MPAGNHVFVPTKILLQARVMLKVYKPAIIAERVDNPETAPHDCASHKVPSHREWKFSVGLYIAITTTADVNVSASYR